MTNEELKVVAWAIREGCGLQGLEAEEAMHAFECAATPDVVLGLVTALEQAQLIGRLAYNFDGYKRVLDERERFRRDAQEALAGQMALFSERDLLKFERDQLKAECEGLRKDAERYRFVIDCPIRTMVALGRKAHEADFDLSVECDRLMGQGGQSND